MKSYEFIEDNKHSGLCKLPEEWRILESLKYYRFQKNLKDFADNPIPATSKKTAEKIIVLSKKILKKEVKEEDFEKLFIDIKKFFFNKDTALSGSINTCLMDSYLGPLDFNNSRIYYDIDDFKEVHVQARDKKMMGRQYAYGLIKTESCGWIGWMIVQGDKALQKKLTSKYVYLTTMNQFKMKTAQEDLFAKYQKYNSEVLQRGLKRFFINNRFWFHDDQEKLDNSLREVTIDNYSDIIGAFRTGY